MMRGWLSTAVRSPNFRRAHRSNLNNRFMSSNLREEVIDARQTSCPTKSVSLVFGDGSSAVLSSLQLRDRCSFGSSQVSSFAGSEIASLSTHADSFDVAFADGASQSFSVSDIAKELWLERFQPPARQSWPYNHTPATHDSNSTNSLFTDLLRWGATRLTPNNSTPFAQEAASFTQILPNEIASTNNNTSDFTLYRCASEPSRIDILDGFTAALALRHSNPEAFSVLSKLKLRNRYRPAADAPLIQLDSSNNISRVNLSVHRFSPVFLLSTDSNECREFNVARQILLDIARRQAATTVNLKPGESLILDSARCHVGASSSTLLAASLSNDLVMKEYFDSAISSNENAFPKTLKSATLAAPTSPIYSRVETGIPKFSTLNNASRAQMQWMTLEYRNETSAAQLAERSLSMLRLLDNDRLYGGPVTLYEHCLQTATRALRSGEDVDVIVMGLLHDAGELLCPSAHGDVIAGILGPFLKPEVTWALAHHEIFQAFHYGAALDMNPNLRDRFKDHPHYGVCERFCRLFDAPSFEKGFASEREEVFRPMVEEVFAREPFWWDKKHPKRGLVTGE
eukprot:c14917_g1_i1.p1 GENE.c14917_g1_i1~~c14917_g1_i1.p1  ORF type:complete len:580 (+),score=114.97 c14917_g1_i1:35-1741(+)